MKKVIRYALMALIVLPLATSCKHQNQPDDPGTDQPGTEQPQTVDEQVAEWTTPLDSLAVPVTVQNLTGFWRAEYISTHIKKDNQLTFLWTSNPDQDSLFYELKANMSFQENVYSSAQAASGDCKKLPIVTELGGKWSLNTNNGEFVLTYDDYLTPQKYTVYIIEAGRLVIAEYYFDELEGKDMVRYRGFKRVQGMPAKPENPIDAMLRAQWRVMSDSVQLYEVKAVTEGNSVTYEDVYIETQKNQMPAYCIFRFAEPEPTSGTDHWYMWIVDQNDKLFSTSEWIDQSPANPTEKYFYLAANTAEFELPESVVLVPDLCDPDKATIRGQKTKEVTVNEKQKIMKWIYFIHVEKVY